VPILLKPFSVLRAVALATLAVSFSQVAPGQDLATLARKEKERRAKVAKPVKVLTEDDGKEAGAKGAGSVTTLPGEAAPSPSPSAEQPAPGQAGGDVDAQKAAWKARATSARSAVAEAEKRLAQMERDLAALRSDMTPLTAAEAQDPMRLQKRDARVVEMNKQIAAQKTAIVEAKKALAAFEDEARRSGVPAGWFR
jgi:hypothetical protein